MVNSRFKCFCDCLIKAKASSGSAAPCKATEQNNCQEEIEQTGTPDSLLDALAPMRSLVESDRALIEGNLYERLRDSDARVIASVRPIETKRISVVVTRRPWVFFAIAGTKLGVPRWVYLDRPDATLVTQKLCDF